MHASKQIVILESHSSQIHDDPKATNHAKPQKGPRYLDPSLIHLYAHAVTCIPNYIYIIYVCVCGSFQPEFLYTHIIYH